MTLDDLIRELTTLRGLRCCGDLDVVEPISPTVNRGHVCLIPDWDEIQSAPAQVLELLAENDKLNQKINEKADV